MKKRILLKLTSDEWEQKHEKNRDKSFVNKTSTIKGLNNHLYLGKLKGGG